MRSLSSLEQMLLEISKVQRVQLESVLQDAVALQVKTDYDILEKNNNLIGKLSYLQLWL